MKTDAELTERLAAAKQYGAMKLHDVYMYLVLTYSRHEMQDEIRILGRCEDLVFRG